MADILDVETALAGIVGAAVYPNGTGQPSAVGATVAVFPGWPNAGCLQSDLKGGKAQVSVFALRGGGATFQHIMEDPGVLVAPVHNVTASIVGAVVTLSGTPGAGEVVTVIVNRSKSYSRTGADVAAIAAALAADIVVDFPGSSATGPALTLAGAVFELTVRIGAAATLVESVRRVSQQFMATVWAPTPALRASIGNLAAVALVNAYRFALPDGSAARLVFARADDNDAEQNTGLYRRDIVVTVEYALTDQFAAFEVTSFVTSLDVSALELLDGVSSPLLLEDGETTIVTEDGVDTIISEPSDPTLTFAQ